MFDLEDGYKLGHNDVDDDDDESDSLDDEEGFRFDEQGYSDSTLRFEHDPARSTPEKTAFTCRGLREGSGLSEEKTRTLWRAMIKRQTAKNPDHTIEMGRVVNYTELSRLDCDFDDFTLFVDIDRTMENLNKERRIVLNQQKRWVSDTRDYKLAATEYIVPDHANNIRLEISQKPSRHACLHSAARLPPFQMV